MKDTRESRASSVYGPPRSARPERLKRLERFAPQTLLGELPDRSRRFIEGLFLGYGLTFQQLRQIVTAERDLTMWGETTLADLWQTGHPEIEDRRTLVRTLMDWHTRIKSAEKIYDPLPESREAPVHTTPERRESAKSINGLCPVASPETVCCQLRTIDAVETCPFRCTYCTIQTFYGRQAAGSAAGGREPGEKHAGGRVAVFDRDFAEKLGAIPPEPGRFRRFGSGQSSDSLVWGDRWGILSELMAFAAARPHHLLELKTKSTRIRPLLSLARPRNVVCSWSLNPDRVISHEERLTPSLGDRLRAARTVADAGTKVAFHFHPIIPYRGWRRDYAEAGERVLRLFDPQEVLFVSFGSLTLIRPVIRAVRRRGGSSRILQMPMALDPKGKITYPDDVKVELFRHMREVFAPWMGDVYLYLCMEKTTIWRRVFGFVYPSNDAFEEDFGRRTMSRL